MKKLLLALPILVVGGQLALADVVYVTARPSPSGTGANTDGTYSEPNVAGSDTTAKGSGVGFLPRDGCRYFGASFSNTTYASGLPGFRLTPTLGVPGGIYQIHHNFSSTAANVSTNISLTVTCSVGGTLSFTAAGTNFIRASGNPATQWKFLGYLTNDVGSVNPSVDFYYLDGHVNAASTVNNRLLVDTFRFTFYEACVDIPVVGVTGPLGTHSTNVVVTGVTNTATTITVYQNSGSGMVAIGQKTSGIVNGNNTVGVTGLVKGGIVGATQTINGQEGCTPTAGLLVGGLNPAVRVVLSVRETTSTGPIGTTGITTGIGTNIHFLGASARLGGAPANGPVLTASPNWQTLTFERGTIVLGNASNTTGQVTGDPGYNATDTIALRAYAYRDVPETSTRIYSRVPAQSTTFTSNDLFSVNWTWDAVSGADGYRLLRSYNNDSYTNTYVDVTGNSFLDSNNSWSSLPPAPVSPSDTQTNASVKWIGSAPLDVQNALHGQWGVLDAIIFAIEDLSDTGPYDFYIDNLQNGSTVFQTFENAVGNTSDYGFRIPSNSGSTSGNLLSAPDSARVSVRAADAGMKSLHVKFQWNGTNDTKWLRFTTSTALGVSNPQINLDEPISLRFLYLPAGVSATTTSLPPTLTISNNVAAQKVLTWSGTHSLQAASAVTGTYTNVPSVTTAPWTNTFNEPAKFFRLNNPLDF